MAEFVNGAPFILVILLLILGFVGLIKGADIFVAGSSSVAKRFSVPSIIIGLTIVAMGTSLPETAVSVTASLADNNALAVSNAVGSNIFNLMVVIGVCAILTSVEVARETIVRDIPLSVICALLLLGLGIWQLGDSGSANAEYVGVLGHIDGVIFIVFFIAYLVFMVRAALKAKRAASVATASNGTEKSAVSPNTEEAVASNGAETTISKDAEEGEDEIKLLSVPKSILFIILGGALIAVGGDLTVDAASRIAIELGMSQTLVGLTIASIGTSLPELVTSIVAARKNELDMALGNAVGSNIFNILMVLGIASAISPIGFIMENVVDICILLVFSLIVWVFAATRKKITRMEGIVMVALYAAYLAYIIARNYM